MAVEISITHTGAGKGNGTQDNPYQSGGIYLEYKATYNGQPGSGKFITQHRWIVNGANAQGYEEVVEAWYGRDGAGNSPSFHPAPKAKLSAVEFLVWVQGYEDQIKTQVCWVMAFEDEPIPMFGIQCSDGITQVNRDDLQWLKDNGHVIEEFPRPRFNGTIEELKELLDGSEPPPLPVDPPDIHPDAKVSLQICYAPIHGFDYDVASTGPGDHRNPEDDIQDMISLGARAICLWVYPQHLFHQTLGWDTLNPCVGWYQHFIDHAKLMDLKVVLKTPFWSVPGWFDKQGVPSFGSERYKAHLSARAKMAMMINKHLGTADYLILGNEPQLTCSEYPYPPVVDTGPPAPRHDPEDMLKITADSLKLADYYTNFQVIGPALSGAIGQVAPPGTYMEPVEFLARLAQPMADQGIQWCGVNPYQLDVFRVPTYTNYGKFYETLAQQYPLWISECGAARKNVPTDAGLKAHLEGLIEHTLVFSPQLFSYFIYRDFNEHGWGLVHQDGSLDERRKVLANYFTDLPPVEVTTRVLAARVRKDYKIDCGVQIQQDGKETIDVLVEIWKAQGSWNKEQEKFVGTDLPGQLLKTVNLKLGPQNPVAFNIMGDLGINQADAIVIRSDQDLGALSVWTSPAQGEWNYSGFAALT